MKLTILGTGNAAVCECYNTCFALTDTNDENCANNQDCQPKKDRKSVV